MREPMRIIKLQIESTVIVINVVVYVNAYLYTYVYI